MEYFTLQVETAKKYGVNASIVLHCIIYFVLTNKRANRNKKKGRFWTYNSYEGWVQSLPFFTATQIRGALQKLREQGAVETGSFNKKGYDKTLWYTVSNEILREAEASEYWTKRISKSKKASEKISRPIPYKEYLSIEPY